MILNASIYNRLISLLPNISKFFEKIIHNRLIEFVERFEILLPNQCGFRKNHSTSLALVHLTNKIASAIDRKKLTAGVFLDLSKAFDTLDHEILFNKLEHHEIRGMALQWIKSYLSNRCKQFVQYRKTCSDEQVIKCGVPQGSVLGPLLFILNINDPPNASKLTESLLLANDTSILYSHSNATHLFSILRWLVPVFSFPRACNIERIGQKQKLRPVYHFCRVELYNILLTKNKCCFVISGFHGNVFKGLFRPTF